MSAVHDTVPPVASRAEQKARTRKALVGSVLRIVGDGANFASISLREVAKTAGVVPTSFYRHFGDMDELGLAVVDQLGLDLRRLMRGSLDTTMPRDELLEEFVSAYQLYVRDNAELVRFVNQARTGGTAPLNKAISDELEYIGTRIAGALNELVPGMKPTDRDTVSKLVLAVLLESIGDLLSLPSNAEEQLAELKQSMIDQLAVILQGADQRGRRRAPARKTVSAKSKAAR